MAEDKDWKHEAEEIEFTIKCRMRRRWARPFLSMLNYMEWCGQAGHSSMIGLYADGDGDYRPKFEVAEFEKFPPQPPMISNYASDNVMFDSDVTPEIMRRFADNTNNCYDNLTEEQKQQVRRWLRDWSKQILGEQIDL